MVGIPGNAKGSKWPSRWLIVGVAITIAIVLLVILFRGSAG